MTTINEQTADYNLADLEPLLDNSQGSTLLDSLPVWLSAQTRKSAGRGRSADNTLQYGVQKLRDLILELAVRGKLVPQDPNDEPASVLLEKIAEEKERLFKDGVIKKAKKLPKVETCDVLFDIPENWQFTRLGVIGQIFNGNSISKAEKESKYISQKEGLPYIATKDVGYGFESLDYDNGVKIPIDERKFKIAEPYSVLICSEGGSAGKKCGITNQRVCFGNKLFAIQSYGDIQSKFILAFYLTPSFQEQFSFRMTGIIGGISTSKFENIPIPLPPIIEQRRIVKKVDELMALCDQLEQQQADAVQAHETLVAVLLETLTKSNNASDFKQNWCLITDHFDTLFTTDYSIDKLRESILQLAVSGRLTSNFNEHSQSVADATDSCDFPLPSNWIWVQISDIVSPQRDVSYGIIKLGKEPKSIGVPTIRCSDVKKMFIDESSIRLVDGVIEKEYTRTRLQGGEVLLNIRGTLGGVAVVPGELSGYNIAREVAMIPVRPETSSNYVMLAIASPYFWTMIENSLKGIAYKGLNLKTLRSLPIPLPPLEEQHRIVKKVDELMALCDQLKDHLNQAQTLQQQLADAVVERGVKS